MRLLNVKTLQLQEFAETERPRYAILSHTWGRREDEVTMEELQKVQFLPADQTLGITARPGYLRITRCCGMAQWNDLDWVWIDTCCINKESSAELSESINSMYRWYQESTACYVYLVDVPVEDINTKTSRFRASRWFTRGWTLQELIAPKTVVFYNQDWQEIGKRDELEGLIGQITGIPPDARNRYFSVAQRMSWAAGRITARLEDQAYCLLGLFDVNMPLLYGEGKKAFQRLQETIISRSRDQSILSWGLKRFLEERVTDCYHHGMSAALPTSFLAESPTAFQGSGNIIPFRLWDNRLGTEFEIYKDSIHMQLPLTVHKQKRESSAVVQLIVLLHCCFSDDFGHLIALPVRELSRNADGLIQLQRLAQPPFLVHAESVQYVALSRCQLLLSSYRTSRDFAPPMPLYPGTIQLRVKQNIVCERVYTSPDLMWERGQGCFSIRATTDLPVEAVFDCLSNNGYRFLLKIEIWFPSIWLVLLLDLLPVSSKQRYIRSTVASSPDPFGYGSLTSSEWKKAIQLGDSTICTSVLYPKTSAPFGPIVTVAPLAPSEQLSIQSKILESWRMIDLRLICQSIMVIVMAFTSVSRILEGSYGLAMLSVQCAAALTAMSVIDIRAYFSRCSLPTLYWYRSWIRSPVATQILASSGLYSARYFGWFTSSHLQEIEVILVVYSTILGIFSWSIGLNWYQQRSWDAGKGSYRIEPS